MSPLKINNISLSHFTRRQSLDNFINQSPSWKCDIKLGLSRNLPSFMKPEGQLLCSQGRTNQSHQINIIFFQLEITLGSYVCRAMKFSLGQSRNFSFFSFILFCHPLSLHFLTYDSTNFSDLKSTTVPIPYQLSLFPFLKLL